MQIVQMVPMCGVLIAAVTDWRRYQIYDRLTIPLLFSGLAFHACSPQGAGVIISVVGVLVGVLPFFAVYSRGGMGAGDIKLLGGVGAWLGPWLMLHVIIVSGLATGCCSAGLLVLQRIRAADAREGTTSHGPTHVTKDLADETNVVDVLNRSDRSLLVIPFGVIVAVAVIVTLIWIN